MAIIVSNSDKFITINSVDYPKNSFRIVPNGERIELVSNSQKVQVSGHYSELINRTEDGDSSFDSIEDITEYLRSVLFKVGGGDGDGVTTDASLLTSGTLHPERLGAGSIIYNKFSQGVKDIIDASKWEYDYIIRTDGTTVFAIPMQGLPQYSGVSFNTVLSSAMDQLTEGGSILITGSYENVSNIQIPHDRIKLKGRGKYLTKLKLKAEADEGFEPGLNNDKTALIDIDKHRCEIHDLELDGNGQNQLYINDGTAVDGAGSISGIRVGGVWYGKIENTVVKNCYIHDFTQFGVWNVLNCVRTKFIDLEIIDCYWNGISLDGSDGLAERCYTRGSGDVGIVTSGLRNTLLNCTVGPMDGMYSSVASRWGIAVERAYPPELVPSGHRIIDCFVVGETPGDIKRGLSLWKAEDIEVSSLTVIAAESGVFIETSNECTLDNIHIKGSRNYGVLIRGGSNNVIQSSDIQTDTSLANGNAGISIEKDGTGVISSHNIIKGNYIKGITALSVDTESVKNSVKNNDLDGLNNDFNDSGTETIIKNNYGYKYGDWLPDGAEGDSEPKLLTGLAAYYKLDETSGDALDYLGSHDGSVTATQGVSGKINTCYSFNGTTDFVDCGVLSSSHSFSVSAWVQKEGGGAKVVASSGNTSGFSFRITGSNYLELLKNYGGLVGSSTTIVPSGTLSHIAVTYDGVSGAYAFYIDGVQSGSGLNSMDFTLGTFTIGAITLWNNAKGDFFNGLIDEVGYWNRPITQAEVAQLYGNGNGLSVDEFTGEESDSDGLILESPNGSKFRIEVSDDGTLSSVGV